MILFTSAESCMSLLRCHILGVACRMKLSLVVLCGDDTSADQDVANTNVSTRQENPGAPGGRHTNVPRSSMSPARARAAQRGSRVGILQRKAKPPVKADFLGSYAGSVKPYNRAGFLDSIHTIFAWTASTQVDSLAVPHLIPRTGPNDMGYSTSLKASTAMSHLQETD